MTLEQLAALFDLAHNCTGQHDERTRSELGRLGLLDDATLTPRGLAFVRHVCALPLPERVTAWQVPRITQSPGAFLEDLNAFGTAALHINGMEEGEPPKGPMPKPFASRIAIPTDPEALSAEANRLLDSGMGMNEVARALEMSEEQAARIFRGA